MGIDAEEYFGTNDIAEALEEECEMIVRREEKRREYEDKICESKTKNIRWDDVYRIETRFRIKENSDTINKSFKTRGELIQECVREYFVIIDKKTNKQLPATFGDELEAVIYAAKQIH